mgnify:CR=1 FL=1
MPKSKTSKPKASKPENLMLYIGKLQRRVNPGIGASRASSMQIESFSKSMLARLVARSGQVARVGKKNTLKKQHIEAALRLVLPAELASTAIEAGEAAIAAIA